MYVRNFAISHKIDVKAILSPLACCGWHGVELAQLAQSMTRYLAFVWTMSSRLHGVVDFIIDYGAISFWNVALLYRVSSEDCEVSNAIKNNGIPSTNFCAQQALHRGNLQDNCCNKVIGVYLASLVTIIRRNLWRPIEGCGKTKSCTIGSFCSKPSMAWN